MRLGVFPSTLRIDSIGDWGTACCPEACKSSGALASPDHDAGEVLECFGALCLTVSAGFLSPASDESSASCPPSISDQCATVRHDHTRGEVPTHQALPAVSASLESKVLRTRTAL